MDGLQILKMRSELIRDEGVSKLAYKDSLGFWTIGVGHLLGNSPRMTEITNYEAMDLLDGDITRAEETLKNLLPSVDNLLYTDEGDIRYRALVNMAFNLGSKLGKFEHFLAAVDKHDWQTASVEMMDSTWAKQVGARATRLQGMILTGKDV
jgi:lysozyme